MEPWLACPITQQHQDGVLQLLDHHIDEDHQRCQAQPPSRAAQKR